MQISYPNVPYHIFTSWNALHRIGILKHESGCNPAFSDSVGMKLAMILSPRYFPSRWPQALRCITRILPFILGCTVRGDAVPVTSDQLRASLDRGESPGNTGQQAMTRMTRR